MAALHDLRPNVCVCTSAVLSVSRAYHYFIALTSGAVYVGSVVVCVLLYVELGEHKDERGRPEANWLLRHVSHLRRACIMLREVMTSADKNCCTAVRIKMRATPENAVNFPSPQ